jgi:hypothetical protein
VPVRRKELVVEAVVAHLVVSAQEMHQAQVLHLQGPEIHKAKRALVVPIDMVPEGQILHVGDLRRERTAGKGRMSALGWPHTAIGGLKP